MSAGLLGPWVSWRQRSRMERSITLAALPLRIDYTHLTALRVCCLVLSLAFTLGFAWFSQDVQSGFLLALFVGTGAFLFPDMWLRRVIRQRRLRIDRELPFVLDMMTLCVESGLSLHGALQHAAQSGPEGPLRDALFRALADMRAGMPRTAALKALAERTDSISVRSWVAALSQADALGMSLGPLLRSQAAQGRSERFQRAERLAMEAPVKMLFPLIGCIFPCTFIILGFPIALELMKAAV